MTEDELMRGITDALTFGGWTWMHIIRSDGVTAGGAGFPDVIAYHPGRHLVILWELKGEKTPITAEQASWIANTAGLPIDSAIVRPVDYDAALGFILGNPSYRFPFADLRRPGTGFAVESTDPLVLRGPHVIRDHLDGETVDEGPPTRDSLAAGRAALAPGEIEPRRDPFRGRGH